MPVDAEGRTELVVRPFKPVGVLVYINGPECGKVHQLGLGARNRVITIGRAPQPGGIELTDSTVSAKHAKIRFEHGRFVWYDLGSVNGTLINGKRVQKQTLNDGDEITVGRTGLVFKEVRR